MIIYYKLSFMLKIKHLSVSCDCLLRFWSEVIELVKLKIGVDLPVNTCSIFFRRLYI